MGRVQACVLYIALMWALLMLGFFYGQYKAINSSSPVVPDDWANADFSGNLKPVIIEEERTAAHGAQHSKELKAMQPVDLANFPPVPQLPIGNGISSPDNQKGPEEKEPLVLIKELPIKELSSLDEERANASPGYTECKAQLLEKDQVKYSRDFQQTPVWIQDVKWKRTMAGCPVGCHYAPKPPQYKDAVVSEKPAKLDGVYSVLRNMESVTNYPAIDTHRAKKRGFDFVMNTHLDSDVPVGYFSWVEYGIMEKVQEKTESAAAAAFISNCGAKSPRLKVLEGLMNHGVKIDSFGKCLHNREEGHKRKKVELLRKYKFALAFENSEETDYVTEKYFQALVTGSVPIVVGAPNIHEYEPAPNSIIHVRNVKEVPQIAEHIKYLLHNDTAYEEMLAWKKTGPTNKFRALLDMSSTHSACRLCVLVATSLRQKDEKRSKRECVCEDQNAGPIHHVFVRERGTFIFKDAFVVIDEKDLLAALKRELYTIFNRGYKPQWIKERPSWSNYEDRNFEIYHIYPVGISQREALYGGGYFKNSAELKDYLQSHPCAQLEVILV